MEKYENLFYVGRNSSKTSNYNFDIHELISKFSFFDFVTEGIKLESKDHAAVVVITPMQHIASYTRNFGMGVHAETFARIQCDIHGGGYLDNMGVIKLSSACNRNYISARAIFESMGRNENGIPIFDAKIHFMIPDKFGPKQLESFKSFCEEYDKEIQLTKRRCNNVLKVTYYRKDIKQSIEVEHLSEIYDYLQTIVDYNLSEDEEEVIIGTPTKQHQI